MTALIGGRDPRRDGTFWLDTMNEYLWRAGVPIDLTPKAFAVLRYLVEHPGRLVTQQELLDALWPDVHVQPEIVKTYIRDIRRILGDQPKAARFIETRPRRGYTFVAAVTNENGSGPAGAGSPSQPTSAGVPSPRLATGAAVRPNSVRDLPRGGTGTPHHPDAGNEAPSSLRDGHRSGAGRRSVRHPGYLVVSREGPQRGTSGRAGEPDALGVGRESLS